MIIPKKRRLFLTESCLSSSGKLVAQTQCVFLLLTFAFSVRPRHGCKAQHHMVFLDRIGLVRSLVNRVCFPTVKASAVLPSLNLSFIISCQVFMPLHVTSTFLSVSIDSRHALDVSKLHMSEWRKVSLELMSASLILQTYRANMWHYTIWGVS